MKFLWCDTETTGLKTENAAPFEIGIIFVSSDKVDGKIKSEEYEYIFYLNPFDINGIEYNEEAGKIHGYTKEMIEKFDPSSIVVPKINQRLQELLEYKNGEKMFFCGYNSTFFDWEHLVSLFKHHGFDFTKFFMDQKLDVFEQVKRAGEMKVLPYLENRKLVTVAKYLHVDLTNAHDAMGDIKATREVAKSLAKLGVPLQ